MLWVLISYLHYTAVDLSQSQSPSPFHHLFPAWDPYVCSLCLYLYFLANKFTYSIFLESTYMC